MSYSKRCLLVKLGQIGDVIMALPAVHALHEDGFEIHWVCGRAVQPLLECYSWIKPIPVDDRAIFFGTPKERVRSIAYLWSKISLQEYDLCATLYYDRRYQLLTVPVRARRKVALSLQGRATILLAGRHHTDEYQRVLLGTEDGCRDHSTSPIRPDRLPLSPLPGRTASRRIALVPGSAKHLIREQAGAGVPEQTLRRWPVENFVVLAQQLLERGWEVVLFGGPDESWVKPHFQHLIVFDCIGTLSLPQVVSAFDACDAVVSTDTGPMHLAGLSVACLVGIFGPTDPAMRLPRRPFSSAIWGGQGFACRPCFDGRAFAPCQFNGCMHQVSPALVLRELDALITARSEGGASPWRIVVPK